MYLPTCPHEQDVTQGQFFCAEFNRFEFKVFLLQDRLPYHWIQFNVMTRHFFFAGERGVLTPLQDCSQYSRLC